ncbi:YeiH family protein [Klebsiella quasipneumoniae subsp. similipneumoniae]|uniref:YeiH family protein n=1 Tax=Klebsiella quasipneumoniae TaxID=1463165 RepID=A0A8H9ZKC9_9ENTR|nr:YeiH family protein [Klebsiella quasipneumoniae]AZJ04092.1 YeiH family protein [Klebsiella quasipneumoniae]AZJ27094.1 YeiH family protein [Klebsiella quasipneumoniae subsp. similipneumoniae]ELC0919294.1 YeiH family protein [Klebsiella quasipneumoniae]MBC4864120.1 YeiH family protein [Klebsiella quasipneumoniae]MBC5044980.1 YeiH family protein [Klebsiella quasipneumoniae]
MTALTLPTKHRSLWHFVPGLALTAALTGAALWAGSFPAIAGAGFSALTLAILFGMVVGNTIYPKIWQPCDGGVIFAKQHLLRLGIILYGFRLTFAQIADVGVSGILIDVLTLSSTFFIACFLGQKVFGLDKHTSWLIGAGSSICGAAAVLASEPVVKAEASKVTVAVATVVIFGTIAIFLYPAMYPLLAHWFTPETYGIYMGSTMHEVAQVVAAGHAVSPDAENAAVIAKMLRVMMLAPFLLFLAARVKQLTPAGNGEKSKITIPWFAIMFILVAVFNSFHLLPKAVVDMLVTLDTVLLAMAMAALGVTTHVSALKKAGAKPLLMALMLFVWLIVGGGAINVAIHSLMA